MRNPSNTGIAKQSHANFARLRQLVQGSLPKFMSLAFAGSFATFVIVSGPPQGPDWRTQDDLSGGADKADHRARAHPDDPDGASLFPASTDAALRLSGLSKAEPFHYQGTAANRARAVECLAAAAWYEAGDDPAGQRAVIQTVVNRVNHPRWPNSFCGVVFEGFERQTGCQFTFTCDGSLKRRQPSSAAWKRAILRSEQALNGFVDESVGTATHYHASYVSPWWSGKLQRLTSVGPHIFYRWAGGKEANRQQRHLGTEQDYKTLVLKSVERSKVFELAATQPTDQLSDRIEAAIPETAPDAAAMPPDRAIFLPLKESEASGRWALAAMKSCKGRQDCQVFGYDDGDDIRRNQARAAQERERPIFLFVRDAASAMTLALWDCQRVERPRKSECLPIERRALTELMRERG